MTSARRRWLSLPLVRTLRAMQFRRLTPLDRGASRGTAIVRHYDARFLERHRADIRGRCLEIGETRHIREYGSDEVTSAEALDLAAHHPEVTVVADLCRADHVEAEQFDCFLIPFVMTVVHDVEAALYHAIRILRPGGTLLVNFGCVDYYLHGGLDMGTGAPLHMFHWFTPIEVENLFRRLDLTDDDYSLEVFGNLFTRMAFQLNLAAEELTDRELDAVDPGHPLLICVRVRRPDGWAPERPDYLPEPYIPPGEPAVLRDDTGHYGDTYRSRRPFR